MVLGSLFAYNISLFGSLFAQKSYDTREIPSVTPFFKKGSI